MSTSLISLQQGNVNKFKISMKKVNIERVNKFPERIKELQWNFQMWLMIILKVTNKAGFHGLSRIEIFGRTTGREGEVKLMSFKG